MTHSKKQNMSVKHSLLIVVLKVFKNNYLKLQVEYITLTDYVTKFKPTKKGKKNLLFALHVRNISHQMSEAWLCESVFEVAWNKGTSLYCNMLGSVIQ